MKRFVVKLGGSLLFDDDGSVKIDFVKNTLTVLREAAKDDTKIIVVVGGGVTARKYIHQARPYVENESALDQLGILASRLNAALLHSIYYKTFPVIPSSLEELARIVASALPVIFMGGLQPGQSTTTVSALAAEATGSQLIIATDVEGVYTADPKRDPSAKLLKSVSIDSLIDIFSKVQKAGEYRLFDSLTLQIIKRAKIHTRVLKGDPPENILRAIEGEDIGTLIEPA
ncbi:MAG: UMP kinase [Infirmifilum sp.]